METIERIIAEHSFFGGLDQAYLNLVVGCASNLRFDAGSYIFKKGDKANAFYLIRERQGGARNIRTGTQTDHRGHAGGRRRPGVVVAAASLSMAIQRACKDRHTRYRVGRKVPASQV